MVEYKTNKNKGDEGGGSDGPCERLLDKKWDSIKDMVDKTNKTGNEYGIIILEGKSKFISTGMKEGEESDIGPTIWNSLKREMFNLMLELEDEHNDIKRHFIHTHPSGHPDNSLGDMVSIPFFQESNTPPTSHLVATELDSGKISLSGLYKNKDIESDDLESLKSQSKVVNNMVERSAITPQMAIQDLIDRYSEWFSQCSTIKDND